MRFVIAVGAALLLSGCIIGDFGTSERYQADFHYTYDLQPGARVNVETFNGAIEITGWDQDKVEINGTKNASTQDGLNDIRIDINHAPGSIDIRTVKPSARMGGFGARYTIHVPRTALLDRITSSNGGIRVNGIQSAAHLRTSNGSIRVENVAGDVEARTSNSAIELDTVKGNVTMKTSNGRIHAENISGNCDAETNNNSISVRLDNSPDAPVRLTTSNGSIDLTMTKQPKNDIRAETRNSSITLHLPANVAARVTADTSNSSISSDFDVTAQLRGEGSKNHLDGMLGSGGPSISLNTSNGHIRIVKGNAD